MNKNGIIAIIVVLILVIAGVAVAAWQLTGNDDNDDKEAVTIKVGAASSLRYALEDLKPIYLDETGNTLELSLQSSGTIVNSILGDEGVYDIFISADKANMDKILAGTESNGSKFTDGPTNLLTNTLSIVINNQAKERYGWTDSDFEDISKFADLLSNSVHGADTISLALGNSSVPAGEYARHYLNDKGVYSSLTSSSKIDIVEHSSVANVTAAVSTGSADIAFVFTSDALSISGTTVIVKTLTWADTGDIIYPACVINNSNGVHSQSKEFLDWLGSSNKAHEVFEKYGFGVYSH
ncbi:MAG: molybdate ABC transporter substrate-binding protein [Candidatus Methanoplasma sp.]|nr:molybdate ABC transporter substrate-binding protein [Candidatus Methanoplasma sp.]